MEFRNQVNTAALLLALTSAMLLGGLARKNALGSMPSHARKGHAVGQEVTDAAEARVPVARYSSIISLSSIADQVLLRIVEPERWIAVSGRSKESAYAHQVSGKVAVSDPVDVEHLLSLRPDVVFVHHLTGQGKLQRLREQGVQLFDLGPMRGLETLVPNILSIGQVINEPQRAEQLARDFEGRFQRVHDGAPRGRAIYLGLHGGSMFGGAKGTSYHDVLAHAGLEDAAASEYEGWPRYTPEQVLMLDPDYVVSHEGGEKLLCSHSQLRQLRACQRFGGVLMVARSLLNDPGLLMLDAAEELRRQLDGVAQQ